jgi:hypothetical protein
MSERFGSWRGQARVEVSWQVEQSEDVRLDGAQRRNMLVDGRRQGDGGAGEVLADGDAPPRSVVGRTLACARAAGLRPASASSRCAKAVRSRYSVRVSTRKARHKSPVNPAMRRSSERYPGRMCRVRVLSRAKPRSWMTCWR